MKRLGLILLAMPFMAMPAFAEAPPLNKIESRTLPPKVVTKRVLDQLADLLIAPEPVHPTHAPTRPLSSLSYSTALKASRQYGVCVGSQLTFQFESDDDSVSATTPTRVSDLSVQHVYYVLHPGDQKDLDDDPSPTELDTFDDGCAHLDIDKTRLIYADEAYQAQRGAWLLAQIVGDLKSGALDPATLCTGTGIDYCKSELRRLDASSLNSVSSCGSELATPNADTCWELEAGGMDLQIHVDDQWRRKVVIAGDIVVVADYRAD